MRTILGVLLVLGLSAALAAAGDTGPGTAYCFGTDCPCGNDDPTAGCINSTGVGGLLTVTGSSSIAANDLAFHGSQLPRNSVTLAVLGTGSGVMPFGDGKFCLAGGPITRMPQHLNSGDLGMASFYNVCDAMTLSGVPLTPGLTLNFQIWNRDAPAKDTPCGRKANLTNAYSITFTP